MLNTLNPIKMIAIVTTVLCVTGCAASETVMPPDNLDRTAGAATAWDARDLLPAQVYGTATIAFARFPLAKMARADEIFEQGVDLRVYGVHAISRQEALIFGALGTSSGIVRSVLLRTKDSGRSWREVLAPEELAYMQEIFFTGTDIGWAVVVRNCEAIEGVTLCRTIDRGKHWRMIGHLPNHGQGAYSTLGLRFADINQGEVWMETTELDAKGEESMVFCRCYTKDGGLSWHYTDMCVEYEKFNCDWIQDWLTTATDGTQWRVFNFHELQDPPEVSIERRGAGQLEWERLAVIPKKYLFR